MGQIPVTPRGIKPLLIGDHVPELDLIDSNGNNFDLGKLTGGKPTILIFYRGWWCPYCNVQLQQLKIHESDLSKLGYQIIAISPDLPEFLRKSIETHKLHFIFLSDSKMTAAMAFGIAYTLDEQTLEQYKKYNINLEEASGEKHHMLPVPSIFITTTDGTIKFEYVNPDYKVRIDPGLLLAAAKVSLI